MDSNNLSEDTKVILLLVCSFGNNEHTKVKPLDLRAYNKLAQWLDRNGMRPADLLSSGGRNKLTGMGIKGLEADRLFALLNRGGAMALAVESWYSKGIWIISRADEDYPKLLKKKLRWSRPPIIYIAGKAESLDRGGLAIVGSRDVDEKGLSFTRRVASLCARQDIQVVSGGARGVDDLAMQSAISEGGTVIGVVADDLVKASLSKKYRNFILKGNLTLISPYSPSLGFSTGRAMGRNKVIYALSDWALVVNSSLEEGGTWAGATENFKNKWVRLFVRTAGSIPVGNRRLLEMGGIAMPEDMIEEEADLRNWFNTLFHVVWPTIEKELKTEKREKDLAEKLNVRIAQLRDWLKLGIKLGKISKLSGPVRYVVSSQNPSDFARKKNQ